VSLSRSGSCLALVPALLALGLCGCGGASAPSPPSPSTAARPNIVVILVDDMANGLVGTDRRLPFLSLPTLDRLANGGVQFKNAFVTTSLCSPSRASILSGLYAHTHGVLVNETTDLSGSVATFPQLLQSAGYKTAFVGKWHMDAGTAAPRPGFNYWVSFNGQGVYDNPVLNVNGSVVHSTGYVTDILTDYAVSWLKSQGQQPFMLFLSHKAPHQPWEPAARDAAKLSSAVLPEPPSYRDPLRDKPSWQRRYAECGGSQTAFVNCPDPLPLALPPWVWSGSTSSHLDYLRTLFAVDDSVSSVQATLDSLGLSGSTYVFFMSDNGFMLGEHRFGDKRVAYEDSIRIPFIVGGAGLVAREPTGLALNIDVAPTILELAGIPAPRTMQGRSLVGMLRGQASSVRDAFLYEYFEEPSIPVVPEILGIRTGQQKLVTYPARPGEDEMYDLSSDPYEMTNLAARADWASTREALRTQMVRLLQETGGSTTSSRSAPARAGAH